jgi:hypothetical protein
MTMGRVASHLAAVAVVFVFLMICAMVWFPSPPSRDGLKDTARQHAVRNCAAALNLNEQYFTRVGQVVHAECRCGRDIDDWAMFRVQPGEVTRIRRSIVTLAHRSPSPNIRQASFIKSDAELLGYHGEHTPDWWTPTQLPDAEIVLVGQLEGTVYVFSEELARSTS